MKKILRLIFPRGIIITISIIIQALFWISVLSIFKDYSFFLITAMSLLTFFCVIHILIKDIYPEQKIAWIIFMTLFPIAGGIFFVFYGSHKMDKKTKKLLNNINEKIKECTSELKNVNISNSNDSNFLRQSEYLKNIANAQIYKNTKVDYYKVGEEMHESLLEELKKATKFIFIESFIIEKGKMWDSIEEILIKKAAEGVDVRVLYDDIGCLFTLPSNYPKKLHKKNIKCIKFNKVNHFINSNFNNRDHRKICVIDGNFGFNGGINLADEYINQKIIYGHWKDTAIMLEGEAVFGLTLMFLSMWNLQTGIIEDYNQYKPNIKSSSDGTFIPYSDTPLDDESVGESVYMNILNTANSYVYITSPYLIITKEMMTALMNAAKSNIDVRIILPGIPDKKIVQFISRSYYESLIKAGIKIYEYTPGFIHSKMFISDDTTAVVGTINLDYRSLDLHYECGTLIYKSKIIKQIKTDFLNTQKKCKEITYKDVKINNKYGIFKYILLGVLRAFSTLL